MDEIRDDVVVGPLSSWPTADVRDAYRLTTAALRRSILAGEDLRDIAASEQEAAMFADELVRRGEL